MTVSSAIEGNAKAMMEQRAAMNMKNVVASDAFGNLSEGNVGELLQYLPAVEIVYDQGGMDGAQLGDMPSKYGALRSMASGSPPASEPGGSSPCLRAARAGCLRKLHPEEEQQSRFGLWHFAAECLRRSDLSPSQVQLLHQRILDRRYAAAGHIV
ncbi:MAG: hypothetical protein ACREIA_06185 [Opitutaceae bacterium]